MKRRGITLVEVVIVVFLVGIALSMTATLLAATMRITRSVADDQLSHTQLARLAARLRSDAHAASSAELIPANDRDADRDAVGLRFVTDDGESILYQRMTDGLSREVRRGEAVVHRDRLTLPVGTQATFMQQEFHSRQLMRLLLQETRNDKTLNTSGAHSTLEAAVGIDRQHSSQSAPAPEESP